jgi:hypothetical protein
MIAKRTIRNTGRSAKQLLACGQRGRSKVGETLRLDRLSSRSGATHPHIAMREARPDADIYQA